MTDTTTIPYPYANWSVTIPTVAYDAAVKVIEAGGNQHKVFTTLKEHGVPVRAGPGKYPASQATTAIMSTHFRGKHPEPTGVTLDDITRLMNDCIDAKQGNKEFALFYMGEPGANAWLAEIGNPSSAVNLGESSGEFSGKGKTPQAAVTNLLKALR